MQRFRSMKTLQKFSSVHAEDHNHFNQQRHLVTHQVYKQRRASCEGAGRRHRAPQRTRHRYRAGIAGPDEDCAIYRQPCHTIRATLQGFLQSPRRRSNRAGEQAVMADAVEAAGSEHNGAFALELSSKLVATTPPHGRERRRRPPGEAAPRGLSQAGRVRFVRLTPSRSSRGAPELGSGWWRKMDSNQRYGLPYCLARLSQLGLSIGDFGRVRGQKCESEQGGLMANRL